MPATKGQVNEYAMLTRHLLSDSYPSGQCSQAQSRVPPGWSPTLPFARISRKKPSEAVCETRRVRLGGSKRSKRFLPAFNERDVALGLGNRIVTKHGNHHVRFYSFFKT